MRNLVLLGLSTLFLSGCAGTPQQAKRISGVEGVEGVVGAATAEPKYCCENGRGAPHVAAVHTMAGDFFPEKECRRRRPGSALLEYSVGVKGRARNITVIQSDSDNFTAVARKILSSYEFSVSAPAELPRTSAQRYTMAVVFNIKGLEPVPAIPDVPTVVITVGAYCG